MTKKQWIKIVGNSWKRKQLETYVSLPSYENQMFHLAINMKSDVKHTIFSCLVKP